MRSGNGRHRRPRQAPALVVAAGVTGSAIALPLLGAGTASAADAETWNRVAECETGGMWSADLGNGYYGGLQFSQETWQAYGGTAYAPRADLASRAQQIAVAEKVFAAQGAAAWETCAPIAGLTVGGGSTAETDPGTSPAPSASAEEPEASAEPAPDAGTPSTADRPATGTEAATVSGTPGSGATGATAGSGATAGPTAPATTPTAPGASPAEPSPTAPGEAPVDGGVPTPASGNGKHRGEPAKEEGATGPTAPVPGDGSVDTGAAVEGRGTGTPTSRGDAAARTADGLAADGTYTVRPGDNLWAIADAHEVPGGWTALYDANREAVGTDPDLIVPGQSLDLAQPKG
ncbi:MULTISPECIES: transglycosylase family protein [Streptomyces]|uniref:Transglycosylase family protein n=1 Tax=Streptomyces changanensis TaxID=2964669 RepID=A0ABY5N8B5_9ACTN|nr:MULTISPECIES: transglycosylase family protein [Streptomyces]UUS31463.1 transglycosylase family protein [Streptomyces changanensis]